jgi:outer membrane protein assembly factor BamB
MSRRLLSLSLLVLAATNVLAEDWPCWRGPRLDGHSAEKNLPIKWSAKDNVAWSTPLPGIGHSSPIIVGDRVFVTTCLLKEEDRLLVCLDRHTGKILWQREVVHSPLEPKHKLNSWSSGTPASDGTHVWVAFARLRPHAPSDDLPRKPRDAGYLQKHATLSDHVSEMVVACYDMDGKQVWAKTPGQFYARHGFSTSPIIYKDTILLNGDQDAEAYVVALDKSTGSERWRIDRGDRIRSYCAPLVVNAGGKTQMVMTGANHVTSYDPDTGKKIWEIDGPTEQYVASPVYGSGLLFITAGFPTYHNMAIRPDGVGNITKSHVEWHESKTAARNAAYVPSPLAFGDWFYVVSDQGYLNCFEAKTGKRLWINRLGDHHSGSPVYGDGHIYLPSDDGVTYVLRAGPEFKVVAENAMGDKCFSSLAIANGKIYLRGEQALHCIGAGR